MGKVQAAVQEIFGPVNPREEITQARLSDLTLAVRKKIEGATSEERRYVSVALGFQTFLSEWILTLSQVKEMAALSASCGRTGRLGPSGIRCPFVLGTLASNCFIS
jgi:hypothetical protein